MAKYDVFLCHAHADKDTIAKALHQAFQQVGLTVWYDDQEIRLGDSIFGKMTEGLQASSFGIILFTPAFLGSSGIRWAEFEAFLAKQLSRERTILLPIVAGVDHEEYVRKLPLLSGQKYARVELDSRTNKPSTSELRKVAKEVGRVVLPERGPDFVDPNASIKQHVDYMNVLNHAECDLSIMAITAGSLIKDSSNALSEASRRGVRIRMLLLDPNRSGSLTESELAVFESFDATTFERPQTAT